MTKRPLTDRIIWALKNRGFTDSSLERLDHDTAEKLVDEIASKESKTGQLCMMGDWYNRALIWQAGFLGEEPYLYDLKRLEFHGKITDNAIAYWSKSKHLTFTPDALEHLRGLGFKTETLRRDRP